MKIFDTITNKNWKGSNYSSNGNSLILHKLASITQNLYLKPGKFLIKLMGKKRAGDGSLVLKISDELDNILFSENLLFSSNNWNEKTFNFSLANYQGNANLIIQREKTTFGSLELGRLIIESIEAEKNLELIRTKVKEKRKTQQHPAFEDNLKTLAIIIPYQIYGGAEVYLKELINFSELSKYQITFFCFPDNAIRNYLTKENLTFRSLKTLDQLSALLISNNFDEIIFYNRADIYQLCVDLKKTQQIESKLIEIYHSDFKWAGSLSHLNYREGLDKFICVSESLGKKIEGVQEIRNVIPVGIDCQKFSSCFYHERIFENQKPIIGLVSRLSKEKNIAYLLCLAEVMTDFNFALVGVGPEEKNLRHLAKIKNLSNVKFLGFKTEPEKYYQLFDALVLPSEMEGTPICILEAMAAEVPVFVSRVGAIPDLVSDRKTGHFLSMDLALDVELIKNNYQNSNVIQNAQEYVWQNHNIQQTSKIFGSLFKNNNYAFTKMNSQAEYILQGEFI